GWGGRSNYAVVSIPHPPPRPSPARGGRSRTAQWLKKNSRVFTTTQTRSSRPRRRSFCLSRCPSTLAFSSSVGSRANAARKISSPAFSGDTFSWISFATRPLPEVTLSLISGEFVRCSTLDRFALLLRAHSHADERGGRSNTSRKYDPKPSCGRFTARACFDILLNAVFVPHT